MRNGKLPGWFIFFALWCIDARADTSSLVALSYQGRMSVDGKPFEGTGKFKFALVNEAGDKNFWSNNPALDGNGAEPAHSVDVSVVNGLYVVILGDSTRPYMAALPLDVFENEPLFLRVWFAEDGGGSQLMYPDQLMESTPVPLSEHYDLGDMKGVRAVPYEERQGLLPGGDRLLGRWEVPKLEAWSPMGATRGKAPSARDLHTMIWTGKEVIVWGGRASKMVFIGDGARYDPLRDAWSPVSSEGAPTARSQHLDVWTGKEMIIWGGYGDDHLSDGAIYNPVSDSWRPMSGVNAPSPRYSVQAVWTGTEMIVWGGSNHPDYFADGRAYNPATDQWRTLSTVNAPSRRYYHGAVWTGKVMCVWGGMSELRGADLNDGALYDPAKDEWRRMNSVGAPSARRNFGMVWTGAEVLVWGGAPLESSTAGGRYNPAQDRWLPMSTQGCPSSRSTFTPVWTGLEMIVWGGSAIDVGISNTGACYDPVKDSWAVMAENGAPEGRQEASAVWTGTEMLVWGGSSRATLDTGGRYSPSRVALDLWSR